MGNLWLELDTVRSSLAEPSFMYTTGCDRMAIDTSEVGRLYKWATNAITLRPVNFGPDFSETDKYEAAKFKLADCVYVSDYWKQVWMKWSIGTQQTSPKYFDPFCQCILPAIQYQPAIDAGNFLISTYANLAQQTLVLDKYNQVLQSDTTLPVLSSIASFPANQGYVVRFHATARRGTNYGSLFAFLFGDYLVDLSLDGSFIVSQSVDNFQSMSKVGSGQWCDANTSLDNMHTLTIFPHSRRYIEIRGSTTLDKPGLTAGLQIDPKTGGHESTTYDVTKINILPAATKPVNGVITQPGPWVIYANRKYLPSIQVSKLAFYNGVFKPAQIFDLPHDLGYAPANIQGASVYPQLNWDGELNGCQLNTGIFSADDVYPPFTASPFQIGVTQVICAGFQFQGLGDLVSDEPNVANYSSGSAELYGYSINKNARFSTNDGQPEQTLIRSFRIDSGSSPENESAEFVINAEPGSVGADFANRDEIDILLFDDETGNLFEGTAIEVELSDAITGPIELKLTCRGRVDSLLTNDSVDKDFTEDINNPGIACKWQGSLRTCFEVGGFEKPSIKFFDNQGNDGTVYDFPLWRELDSGGANGGGKTDGTIGGAGRWRPVPDKPIFEFMDHLIRQVFGWHWVWNRPSREWWVYQRPKPSPDDKNKIPVAAFFGSRDAMNAWQEANSGANVPCYLHANRKRKGKRPAYSTLDIYTTFPSFGYPNNAAIQAAAVAAANGYPDIPVGVTVDRLQHIFCENPNAYSKYPGQPIDRNHPDYIGKRRGKVIKTAFGANWENFNWLGRRYYEDLCFGYQAITFEADWGDDVTGNLHKWDLILVDPDPSSFGENTNGFAYFERYEARGEDGGPRRATYTASDYRADAPPPR